LRLCAQCRLQDRQISLRKIEIDGRWAAQLCVTIHSALDPKYEEFRARTVWSLSDAFTSAFKELEPIPQFKATA